MNTLVNKLQLILPPRGLPWAPAECAHAHAQGPQSPLLGPRVFLILQGCISGHSGQTSGEDRSHTLGGHTFPNITHTKYPLSLHPSANSYASFNTQLELLYTALPDSPISGPLLTIRASLTQSCVYQTETEHFLRVWHDASCWETVARKTNTASAPGEFTALAFGLLLKRFWVFCETGSWWGAGVESALCVPWPGRGSGTQQMLG